jgi:hypothetical protein
MSECETAREREYSIADVGFLIAQLQPNTNPRCMIGSATEIYIACTRQDCATLHLESYRALSPDRRTQEGSTSLRSDVKKFTGLQLA